MTEKSILFSAPMVRAILEGRKTMTRRLIKTDPRQHYYLKNEQLHYELGVHGTMSSVVKNKYQIGDMLWVREAWRAPMLIDNLSPARICAASTEAGYKKPWCPIYWEADKTTSNWDEYLADDQPGRLRASMHLPRAFSRINLRVTGVKIERLQDISEADAKVEGVEFDDFNEAWTDYGHDIEERYWRNSATESFKSLWELINGQGSWAANPWVAATSFERVE